MVIFVWMFCVLANNLYIGTIGKREQQVWGDFFFANQFISIPIDGRAITIPVPIPLQPFFNYISFPSLSITIPPFSVHLSYF